MQFIFLLAVRTHVRYLVDMHSAIAIFQSFADVGGLSTSTISSPFVDDHELKLLDFI